jgi:hypothetical protein
MRFDRYVCIWEFSGGRVHFVQDKMIFAHSVKIRPPQLCVFLHNEV